MAGDLAERRRSARKCECVILVESIHHQAEQLGAVEEAEGRGGERGRHCEQ